MSEASELLLRHLPAIQQIITAVCRRKGMTLDEVEEFSAVVRLRMVENDYAVLRAFQGRSTFKTYLTSVVTRMLIDHQREEWGKWRRSAGAERLGTAAVELERHLYRDGRALEEALTIVGARFPEIPRPELVELAEQLTPRARRQVVALEEACDVVIPDACEDTERRDTAVRISHTAQAFMARLETDDRLLLKLRFDAEMSVREISQSLRLDYQPLWRRLQKLYRDLRWALERAGIAAADVEKVIGSDVLLDFHLKNSDAVPSEEIESSEARRQEDMSS
ncbi:MAG TPA: sigma-70 family RNA polymerase sigma factor [Thermoanaerobaculia bacterium]|jgi:RNA polymerase sigma factor for flagellar operon FliA